jgi:hypothetical protein
MVLPRARASRRRRLREPKQHRIVYGTVTANHLWHGHSKRFLARLLRTVYGTFIRLGSIRRGRACIGASDATFEEWDCDNAGAAAGFADAAYFIISKYLPQPNEFSRALISARGSKIWTGRRTPMRWRRHACCH